MFNPGSSQLSSTDHHENVESHKYEETQRNDILPPPPNNDDSSSIHEAESFSPVDINVGNDGFEYFQEGSPPKSKEAPRTETHFTSFTTSQKCVTSLMILLDSLNCPDYAFEKILNWARTSFVAGFDFNPKCKKRWGNVKSMFQMIHKSDEMLPSLRQINLPVPLADVDTLDVIYYEFVPQLLSMLQDKELMSADNLVLDSTNPLAKFVPQDGRLGEALSGSVYSKLYDELVTDPTKQLVIPLIFYTDATQVDALSRFSVEPLLFTIAILSYAARCRSSSWRPLGYVQHIKSNLRSDNRIVSSTSKAQNYHAQLAAMLESLKKVQTGEDSRLKNVEIYLFGKVVKVDLLCPILFISCDTPAADKLCGHYSSYGEGVQRVTCSCNVPFDSLDDPYYPCQPVTWSDMKHIITNGTDEELSAVSQHRLDLAFSDLVIGDPVYNIFGSLPTDTMHALRIRTMGTALQLIVNCLTPKQKHTLDELAQSFHKTHRQTGRKFFPKTDFSNGVCSLSNMTASERAGQVFLLVCLSQFDEGWYILNRGLLAKGHDTDLSEVLEILEALCCFDAWTRLDKFWHYSKQKQLAEQATESLAFLLLMVSNCLPREDGNGWRLPTFHNLTHIVSDMCKYGKPKETNTEIGEKNHKVFAKRIGRRCRKQHSTFAHQVSSRLSEAFILNKVGMIMGLLDDVKDLECDVSEDSDVVFMNIECAKGTHFTIEHNGMAVVCNWKSATEEHLLRCDQDVLDYLYSIVSSHEDSVTSVHCCTEYLYHGLFIRCHPCYQGEGPWFDWVNVHFAESIMDGVTYPEGKYPCKVFAIVPKQYNPSMEETHILVRSALGRTHKDSVLFTEWTVMDHFLLVPIDSLEESLFVLELGNNTIAVARPYSDWPREFTDTTEYTHKSSK